MGDGASRASVRETHVSIVFFVGDRAYKLKKPVRTDFLDLTTREARHQACVREVELNRRLAPDVYLGVADINGVDGAPADHLVVMRRMPDDRRLSKLVQSGADVGDDLRAIARAIAAFHARAETSSAIADAGRSEHVRGLWHANTHMMEGLREGPLDQELVQRVAHLADRYLDGRAPLFDARREGRRVRDGHGDLLADDVFCLDDGPRILDCLEFDDALRYGDVLADVAFLAMDLERLGAASLARSFLDWYREFSGETHPASLEHHYVAYRAHVRAKVACLRWSQGDESAGGEADALLALAHDHLERGRVTLVLVGGDPGSGKSTVARELADELGWAVLRTDELRKDLAGVERTTHRREPYETGLYGGEATARTYAALLDRARALLAMGESVILDASWHDASLRRRARALASSTSSDLVELRCAAPPDVLHARLEARMAAEQDPSDATPAIAARMAAETDPWMEATTVDTSGSIEEVGALARQIVLGAGRG